MELDRRTQTRLESTRRKKARSFSFMAYFGLYYWICGTDGYIKGDFSSNQAAALIFFLPPFTAATSKDSCCCFLFKIFHSPHCPSIFSALFKRVSDDFVDVVDLLNQWCEIGARKKNSFIGAFSTLFFPIWIFDDLDVGNTQSAKFLCSKRKTKRGRSARSAFVEIRSDCVHHLLNSFSYSSSCLF